MQMTEHQVTQVPIHSIASGLNDRTVFDQNALKELADSIREHGLAQPPTVRPVGLVCSRCHTPVAWDSPADPFQPITLDRGWRCETCDRAYDRTELTPMFELVMGERRWRACKLLGWEAIPVIIRQLSDEAAADLMLVENIARKDLDPMDEANAYKSRMDRFGWTMVEVARKAQKSEKHVSARLALLDLVPEAQHLVRSGNISVGYGEAMAPLDANRQRIAMQYFNTTNRPLLREFRAICGKLAAEQAQEALFDPDQFFVQVIESHEAERDQRYQRKFPVDESLPAMMRDGSIGRSFEAYLAQLLASSDPHHRAAAPIVGRVYEGMLACGMAYPPREDSPLDVLLKKEAA